MAAEYDPDYWDRQFEEVMADYAGRNVTPSMIAEMESRLRPIEEGRRQAAQTAFPWVEYWFEEDGFAARLRANMTEDDALEIRRRRVEDNYSWRSIAEWAYENRREGWRLGWTMPGLQEVGMLLCQVTADRLGEDAEADPWN